jgi:hypothetical protein
MEPVRGNASCVKLRDAIVLRFGTEIVVDNLAEAQNAFGWKLESRPRFLFSVSTLDGSLPIDRFDLQISLVDDSLENGDILFGPEFAER